jgi:hypothetical protein
MKNKLFKLTIKIGKQPTKEGIFEFETDNPLKRLNSIDVPKLFEPCEIILELGGLKAIRTINAFKAKQIFRNELRAYFFLKEMIWTLK